MNVGVSLVSAEFSKRFPGFPATFLEFLQDFLRFSLAFCASFHGFHRVSQVSCSFDLRKVFQGFCRFSWIS